jgi:mannose-6-phosphate isomerase-like protein (cupin superfamily)
MSLKARGDEVPRRRVTLEEGTSFDTTFVSGRHVNLMIAHRPAGYHSRPHAHDAEQLNYVQEGEVWFFVDDRGYHLRQGDFFRVPRSAVHWMWNRTSRPLVLIEAHAPSLADDPLFESFGVRLLDGAEDPSVEGSARNMMMKVDPAPVEAKYPDPTGPGEP